jgi:hypothetical protein
LPTAAHTPVLTTPFVEIVHRKDHYRQQRQDVNDDTEENREYKTRRRQIR